MKKTTPTPRKKQSQKKERPKNNKIFSLRFLLSGLTSVQLAERVGVTPTTVRRWKNGDREISDALLVAALHAMAAPTANPARKKAGKKKAAK